MFEELKDIGQEWRFRDWYIVIQHYRHWKHDTNTRSPAQAHLLRNQARLESMNMVCDLTQNKGVGHVYFSFIDGGIVADTVVDQA